MKKRTKQLLGLLLFICLITQAQVDIVKSGSYTVTTTETLTASNSIRLLPNTWIKSGSTFVAKIDPNLPLVQPPVPYVAPNLSNENYILTRVFKTAMQNETGITDIKDVAETITYFDGLGRPMQQNAIKLSNTGKDIVTPIVYDAYGRQDKDYLPYASSQNNGSYITGTTALTDVAAFYNTTGYENTLNPFSQKEFEASPLNRVLKHAAPGNDWALGSGHEIKLDYQTNTAIDAVKLFSVTANWDLTKGLYDIPNSLTPADYANFQLYKTTTYDENTAATPTETAGSTVEFKDKEEKIILKRTYESSVKHDTYYVYDQYNNLTFVIPPLADTTATITNTVLDNLCYQYKYDYRNRLVEKKLPGKQWEFIVYDKLDRVLATGPTLSPFNDSAAGEVGWMITKYDVFNRPVYTGWESSTTVTSEGRTAKQNTMNGLTSFNESKITTGAIDGIAANYTNQVAPSNFKLLTVNYYDNYLFSNVSAIPTTIEEQAVSTNLKTLPTGSWVRVLTNTASLNGETTTLFYDNKGRPIGSYLQNYLGGYTKTDSKLDFVGQTLCTKTYHKRLSTDDELKTSEVFSYSQQGRLLTHTHQINNQTMQTLVSNTYDELGKLISKRVGGGLQKVDYTYNIRGWLNGINDISNLQTATDPKDLFSFKINYNTTAGGIAEVKSLYNGNIAETYWRTASDNVLRKYGYGYDPLNRLKNGIYQKPENANPVPSSYNESINYDKNGNIISLTRNGDIEGALPTNSIDNLSYTYNANQLLKVDDLSNNTSGFKDIITTGDDYSYDANGNMTTDANKGMTEIIYNHLNLPTKITFGTTGTIAYVYNAMGQKVEKKVTQGTTITKTEYLGGYQYKGVGTATPTLQFFPTAEGYVNKPTSTTYGYVFNYTDHLGNVRLSYQDKNKDATITSDEILEENNYYPFGMKHEGYNSTGTPPNYKYKYNGKELQDELGLNFYDYGARNYDPAIGRWMNVDPLAEKFPSWSPYNYCMQNPVNLIDPTGMEPDEVIITGGQSQQALQELQKSVQGQLNLAMDQNGKVSYTQVGTGTLSNDAQQLVNAVNDSSITVNVSATNNTVTSTGNLYIGGAFMGNTVTTSATGNTVSANQEINPGVLGTMSTYYNQPGADTLHEVTEAYQGALISQSSGVSSGVAGTQNSVYNAAHNAATPQSGPVNQTVYDANNNAVQQNANGSYPPSAVRAEFTVQQGNRPPVIIQTLP